jgi:hypothetical protein
LKKKPIIIEKRKTMGSTSFSVWLFLAANIPIATKENKGSIPIKGARDHATSYL